MKFKVRQFVDFLMCVRKISSAFRPPVQLDFEGGIARATARAGLPPVFELKLCSGQAQGGHGVAFLDAAALSVLYKALKAAGTGTVEFTYSPDNEGFVEFAVSDSGCEFRLARRDLYTFELELGDPGGSQHDFEIETDRFRAASKLALAHTSSDSARPNLMNVSFGRGARMLATDGRRAVLIPTPEIDPAREFAIHRQVLKVAEYAAGKFSGDSIQMALHENHVVFEMGSVALITRLDDDTFPDLDAVINLESRERTWFGRLDRREVLDTLEKISPFASPRTHLVALGLGESHIELCCINHDTGDEASSRLAAEVEVTGGKKVSFNHDLLSDAFKSFDDTEIQMDFANPFSAVLFSGADDGPAIILMPMRL